MTKRYFFQSFVAATALLAAAGSAHAQATTGAISAGVTYYYGTYYDTPAAAGTLQYTGAISSQGGLCSVYSGPCDSITAPPTSGDAAGILSGSGGTTSAAGYIEIYTPSAIANYVLTVTIQNYGGRGDIYDIVVDGNSIGVTTPVTYSVSAAGSNGAPSTVIDGGNVPVSISITDLLEQFIGSGTTYTVPKQLPGGTSIEDAPNTAVLNEPTYTTPSEFTLTATFAPIPEPATLSIFALGTVALGAARRRRRAKAQKTAA